MSTTRRSARLRCSSGSEQMTSTPSRRAELCCAVADQALRVASTGVDAFDHDRKSQSQLFGGERVPGDVSGGPGRVSYTAADQRLFDGIDPHEGGFGDAAQAPARSSTCRWPANHRSRRALRGSMAGGLCPASTIPEMYGALSIYVNSPPRTLLSSRSRTLVLRTPDRRRRIPFVPSRGWVLSALRQSELPTPAGRERRQGRGMRTLRVPVAPGAAAS